jgi:hypothetical protein
MRLSLPDHKGSSNIVGRMNDQPNMNIYTKTLTHKVFVKEDQLKLNFYAYSIQSLREHIVYRPNITEFEIQMRGFQEDFYKFSKEGFNYLFSNGFTEILLDENAFDYVSEFFEFKLDEKGEELQIVIELNDGRTEIIHQDEIKL